MKPFLKRLALLCAFLPTLSFAQFLAPTPNLGFQNPAVGSTNWDPAWYFNFTQLDDLLSGNSTVPGFAIQGKFTVPNTAAFVSAATGQIGYDTTKNNLHAFIGNADSIILTIPANATVTNNDCAVLTNVNGKIGIADGGSTCGGSASAITAITGDLTTSAGPGSVVGTLAATGVTAGAYQNPNITVDAKGRVTAAASGVPCLGVANWVSTTAYLVGFQVCLSQTLYTAVENSTNQMPSPTSDFWEQTFDEGGGIIGGQFLSEGAFFSNDTPGAEFASVSGNPLAFQQTIGNNNYVWGGDNDQKTNNFWSIELGGTSNPPIARNFTINWLAGGFGADEWHQAFDNFLCWTAASNASNSACHLGISADADGVSLDIGTSKGNTGGNLKVNNLTVEGTCTGCGTSGGGSGGAAFPATPGIVFALTTTTSRDAAASDLTALLGFTPLKPSNNLSDLTSVSTARTNLGLGTAAQQPATAFDPSGAAANAQSASLQKVNNLSDVQSASISLSNIGGQPLLGFTPLNPANNLSDVANSATARANLGITASSGTISGQAAGVIPLATAATTIGAQSHLSDNGSQISSSLPFGITGTTPGIVSFAAGTGTIPALPANSFSILAPQTGGTSYAWQPPATATAGFLKSSAPTTNANGILVSTVTPASVEFTLNAPQNTWGNGFAAGTPVAFFKAINAGHVASLTVANSSTASCTTAPSFNVIDFVGGNTGDSAPGTPLSASATGSGLGGIFTTNTQSLTFSAGDIVEIFIQSAGATCTTSTFLASAEISIP